jgi:hypothetical protein
MAESPMLEYRIVENGSAFTETYLLDGELHREDGPAAIMRRTSDGRIAWETWYRHGKLHRQHGPAATYYNLQTGRVEEAFYFREGRLEREDGGPECIEFDPDNGRIRNASWWRNDEPQPLTLSRWLWLTRARAEGAP